MSQIKLSDHFTYRKLLRFSIPTIIMMIFTSIYGVVDGIFITKFAGSLCFDAVNLVMPFMMLLAMFAYIIGTGGSALIAKTLGEGEPQKANRIFSLLVYLTIALGVTVSIIGQLSVKSVVHLLGYNVKDQAVFHYSVQYARILLISLPFFMLQNVFQSFFAVAERTQTGLYVIVCAGVMNMILDALFVGVFKWGIVGAGCATAVSEFIGGGFPVIYFIRKNSSCFRLGKTSFSGKDVWRTVTNGASEFMTSISMNVVAISYNFQLLRIYHGSTVGLGAYGFIMYVQFIFAAVFIGYSIASSQIISYHYGANNRQELHNLLRKSLVLVGSCSVVMFGLSQALSGPLANLFTTTDELYRIYSQSFRINAIGYLFFGFCIFSSGFFTALNNGLISAIISFVRTFVFQLVAIFTLPILFGDQAIWLAYGFAELMSLILSVVFLVIFRKKYGY